MSLLSDRVLLCTVWVLFVLAIGVLVVAIYLPMKAIVAQDDASQSKPQPVQTQKPVRKKYPTYEVLRIDARIKTGDV